MNKYDVKFSIWLPSLSLPRRSSLTRWLPSRGNVIFTHLCGWTMKFSRLARTGIILPLQHTGMEVPDG